MWESLTALIGGPRIRHRLAVVATASTVAVALVLLTSVAPAITSPVGNRLESILAPSQVEQSASFEDRAYELSFAFPSIARHPWFGVGPRQFYGAYLVTPDGSGARFFVQNLYIDLATDYGVPAAIAFS